jgi:hypothetical protein
VEHGLRGNVSVIDVTPTRSTQGAAAEHLGGVLRGHRPAFRTYVTGSAASLADFKAEITTRAPFAAAWIALAGASSRPRRRLSCGGWESWWASRRESVRIGR